jgi:hypothetical protein
MKENTETISEIIFTHFPSGHTRGNQTSLLFKALKKRALSFKRQLLSGAASLGIGTVFLVAFYLFFSQLAEYGWQ